MSYADDASDQNGRGGGSWLDDVLDVFSPQPPAPPSPKAPSVPDTKLPWAPQGKLTQVQDNIRNDDYYAPIKDPQTDKIIQTRCNMASGDTVKTMGWPVDDLKYPNSNNYMLANDAWLNLPKSKQWHEVQPNEAQDIGNQGVPVIGVQPNWERDANGKFRHGHMVTVRPEDHAGLAELQGEAPIVNNVGAERNVVPAAKAFTGPWPVRYYAPNTR